MFQTQSKPSSPPLTSANIPTSALKSLSSSPDITLLLSNLSPFSRPLPLTLLPFDLPLLSHACFWLVFTFFFLYRRFKALMSTV